jgi:hypothetical protein
MVSNKTSFLIYEMPYKDAKEFVTKSLLDDSDSSLASVKLRRSKVVKDYLDSHLTAIQESPVFAKVNELLGYESTNHRSDFSALFVPSCQKNKEDTIQFFYSPKLGIDATILGELGDLLVFLGYEFAYIGQTTISENKDTRSSNPGFIRNVVSLDISEYSPLHKSLGFDMRSIVSSWMQHVEEEISVSLKQLISNFIRKNENLSLPRVTVSVKNTADKKKTVLDVFYNWKASDEMEEETRFAKAVRVKVLSEFNKLKSK